MGLTKGQSSHLFWPLGEVTLIEDYYIIPLRMNYSGIRDEFTNLDGNINQVRSMLTEFKTLMTNHHHRTSELRSDNHIAQTISNHMVGQLDTLTNNLVEWKSEIKGFISNWSQPNQGKDEESTPDRQRRGLIDAGGIALQYALGIATQKDVKEQENRINNIESLLQNQRDALNIHNEVLNISVSQISRIKEQNNKLVIAINHLKDNLRKIMTIDQFQFDNIGNLIMLIAAISYINSGMLKLYTDLKQFEHNYESLNMGSLEPGTLSDQQIRDTMNFMIENKISLIFPPSTLGITLYRRAMIIEKTNNSYEFFLKIPIAAGRDLNFKLFEVRNTIYVQSPDIIISLDTLPKFFAINKIEDLHLSFNSIDRCKKINDLFLCENFIPISKKTDSCVIQLFKNVAGLPNCNKQVQFDNKTEKFYKIPSGWLYAVSKDTPGLLHCGDRGTSNIIIKSGSGQLNVKGGCRIITAHHILPSDSQQLSTSTIKINSATPMKLDIGDEILFSNNINSSLLVDHLKTFEEPIPLHLINDKLSQSKHKLEQENFYNSMTKIGLGMSITNSCLLVGGGLILTYIIYICKKIRRKREVLRTLRADRSEMRI